MRDKDGNLYGDPVKFTPIMLIVGSGAYQLALHKLQNGTWKLSHPESGSMICRVYDTRNGFKMSSNDLTLTQIKPMAIEQLDELVNRVGANVFDSVLRRQTDRYKDSVA